MAIFDDDQRRDRPQPPSALRVATGRADGFVAPPGNTQEYGFVVASRLSGMVVAAMFAAAMSSIDSGINSITAVISRDFLDRFGRLPADEKGRTLLAKVLTLGIGCLVIAASSFLDQVPGNFWALGYKTSALLQTPLFALFFFGSSGALCNASRCRRRSSLRHHDGSPGGVFRSPLWQDGRRSGSRQFHVDRASRADRESSRGNPLQLCPLQVSNPLIKGPLTWRDANPNLIRPLAACRT